MFNAYKIDVDNRHLQLIADYMVCFRYPRNLHDMLTGCQTFDGGYKPFNHRMEVFLQILLLFSEGFVRDNGSFLV